MPRVQGLPLLKPPYARITAIDLNTGEHVWMTPNGDGPRNHPAIKHLNTGPLGTSAGGPLVTKTLLIVGQDRGLGENNTPRLNVFDKTNGRLLGHIPLPDTPNGCPVTYMHNGKQYIAISVGGGPFFSGFSEDDIEIASKESGIDPQTLRMLSQIPSTTPKLVAYALPEVWRAPVVK